MNILYELVLTFLIELGIYFIFIKDKKVKIVLYCLLVNSITWPLANLLYESVNSFLLIEFLVFACESALIFYLFEIKLKKAILISLVANLITASIGFFISNL